MTGGRDREREAETAPDKPDQAAPARERPLEEPPPDRVEEADEESFPASDPPGWTPLHSGPPTE